MKININMCLKPQYLVYIDYKSGKDKLFSGLNNQIIIPGGLPELVDQ